MGKKQITVNGRQYTATFPVEILTRVEKLAIVGCVSNLAFATVMDRGGRQFAELFVSIWWILTAATAIGIIARHARDAYGRRKYLAAFRAAAAKYNRES